jgi:hypothetical protein
MSDLYHFTVDVFYYCPGFNTIFYSKIYEKQISVLRNLIMHI